MYFNLAAFLSGLNSILVLTIDNNLKLLFTAFQESTLLNSLFSTCLNLMFPIRMMLRLYSFIILMFDIAWVMINAVCAVLQACYELFRPPPMKSIRLETVLVRIF